MPKETIPPESPCPCGTGKPINRCCGPFLNAAELPATAEQLMRSRYSAYATFDLEYVQNTWHPNTLPPKLKLVPDQVWIGLKIKRVEAGMAEDTSGIVEFEAKSKRAGRARKMREASQFEKIDGRWFYVSGDYEAS